MSMFRFWSSDSRGSGKLVHADHMMPGLVKPVPLLSDCSQVSQPTKRKIACAGDVALTETGMEPPSPKRVKVEAGAGLPGLDMPSQDQVDVNEDTTSGLVDGVKDIIERELSFEILLKHNELRLIDQELAKCQVALEQLRRCHLIPYPTHCPTPDQMIQISSGKGPAMRKRKGDAVPRWAAPFGVVDGPYARHYAKWLVPDPAFDGIVADWQLISHAAPSRNTAEGRTTRNSLADTTSSGKHRGTRNPPPHKLQALSNGYPQPKEKNGPCVWTRGDGTTVKLVCIDCHRDNFSSVQGFINHCRIAHKRDFKSHEEAAKHCGHPIEVDEPRPVIAVEERTVPVVASGLVHDLVRPDSETSKAVLSRIEATVKMMFKKPSPRASTIPAVAITKGHTKPRHTFVGSDSTPYLSELLRGKSFAVDLSSSIADAKTIDEDYDEFSEDDSEGEPNAGENRGLATSLLTGVRAPAVARMSVKSSLSSVLAGDQRSATGSNKALSHRLSFSATEGQGTEAARARACLIRTDTVQSAGYDDEEMEIELSPNTATSNHAPSLVSDDGEYDDSDDGSASEVSEHDVEAMSSVAEVNINDDGVADHEDPPSPRHHHTATNNAVKFKKDETKPVAFVGPVARDANNGRRKRKA